MKKKSSMLNYVCVKESVFPFDRFPGEDIILGPEMKSTGEVMGIDQFPYGIFKITNGCRQYFTTKDLFLYLLEEEENIIYLSAFKKLNYKIFTTKGTSTFLKSFVLILIRK